MKKIWSKIVSIAAAVVVAFSALTPTVRAVAEDTTTSTTSVMQDLTSAGVDKNDYPAKTVQEVKDAGAAHLQLIRIGESVNDELFLYVYQPCDEEKELEASKVVINQTANLEATAQVYDLKLVSTEGVFDKYLVEGLKVLSSLSQRNYSITSIMRRYDKELDAEKYANTGGDIEYVPETVAQIWYARNAANGDREYAYTQDKVITVADRWHGTLFFMSNLTQFQYSHFVAFTTDKKIDELKSVELTYAGDKCAYVVKLDKNVIKKIGEISPQYVKISEGERGNNGANGWFEKYYEWEKIRTVESFINEKNQELSDDAILNLERVQSTANQNGTNAWILGYFDDEIELKIKNDYGGLAYAEFVDVTNVMLLKLTFRTAGITYTMGVVDTMVTPDDIEDGNGVKSDHWAWLKDAVNSMTKTLRTITLAVGAVFALGVLAIIVYGMVTLINWMRDGVHRRK